jgi:hypothetical protein
LDKNPLLHHNHRFGYCTLETKKMLLSQVQKVSDSGDINMNVTLAGNLDGKWPSVMGCLFASAMKSP